ncbi:MAG: DUF721 domain-containing protein [Acidimicrobiia bacterium]|nr:DUF721 domain-containing protein [Acidimicrobiia bacterium]MDH5236564.1 DUF721 domain-containing protein [Acidimicrobiia bacterium]
MTEPVPLRAGVERLLRHLDAPQADTVARVFEYWAQVVGPGIAEHSRPVSIDDGCLVVAVDDPAWASHLRWSQDEVISRMAEQLETHEIESIRFVVRPAQPRPEAPPVRP